MRPGFIAISTVLVITAVITSIVTTMALLGIGEAQTGLAHADGQSQLSLAEGCMEDALIKIWANASYAGGTITRPEGTCTITVVNAANYTVTATTTSSNYRRTVQTTFTRTTQINLLSWKEI